MASDRGWKQVRGNISAKSVILAIAAAAVVFFVNGALRWLFRTSLMLLCTLALAAVAFAALSLGVHEYRRRMVGDSQRPFYPGSTAHSVIYLASKSDTEEAVSSLCCSVVDALQASGARPVYVGRCIGVCMRPSAFDALEWDVVLITQHESLEAAEAALLNDAAICQALSQSAGCHCLLARRPPLLTLAAPTLLLLSYVAKFFFGPLSAFESVDKLEPGIPALLLKLRRASKRSNASGATPVVLCRYNLPLEGREEKDVDVSYQASIARLLGEFGGGALHFCRVKATQDDSTFVHGHCGTFTAELWPKFDFLLDFFQSKFWADMAKVRRLDKTLAVATIPFNFAAADGGDLNSMD